MHGWESSFQIKYSSFSLAQNIRKDPPLLFIRYGTPELLMVLFSIMYGMYFIILSASVFIFNALLIIWGVKLIIFGSYTIIFGAFSITFGAKIWNFPLA